MKLGVDRIGYENDKMIDTIYFLPQKKISEIFFTKIEQEFDIKWNITRIMVKMA